jgi:hypothetical protein
MGLSLVRRLVGLVEVVGRARMRLRERGSVRGGWRSDMVILGCWARYGREEAQQLRERDKRKK